MLRVVTIEVDSNPFEFVEVQISATTNELLQLFSTEQLAIPFKNYYYNNYYYYYYYFIHYYSI